MIKPRGAVWLVLVGSVLALARCEGAALPSVSIDDTTSPISVTGAGFTSFRTGMIDGNSEAVWWFGTVNPLSGSLGLGTKSGIWTDPVTSQESDKFLVVAALGLAYGVFLSDPFNVPASFTIPNTQINIDLTSFAGAVTEPGQLTQLSPDPDLLSVMAVSMPDSSGTGVLLALAFMGMVWMTRYYRTFRRL